MEEVSVELGTVVSNFDLEPSLGGFFYSLVSQHISFPLDRLGVVTHLCETALRSSEIHSMAIGKLSF